MGSFNYTDIHLFDKKGIELPLVYDSNIIARIPSKKGHDAVFYGVLDEPNGNLKYYCKNEGTRFAEEDFNTIAPLYGTCTVNGYIVYGDSSTYTDMTAGIEVADISDAEDASRIYVINELTRVNYPIGDVEFPTTTFSSAINFDAISTGLVESQSLYLLGEHGGNYVRISEIPGASQIISKYRLLFYINTKDQTNFRFFSVDNDEIVWSNKQIVNFNQEGEDGFRVNIGFTADEEGVYEDTMYICVLDANNEIYPIGSIKLYAEAIGEDERYRTLFTNFGVPDPKEYYDVFADTDSNEDSIDYVKLNKNSKKLFLSYSDIFPYAGTYKALINAIKVLGYEDVFFKEWYKEIGKTTTNNTYIAYDVSYKADLNANTINNLSIEERISLRKLNWLSMVYRINEELEDKGYDKYGFPYTKSVYGYNNADILVKLVSLKKWLEKFVIGLNCRIIDVGGEGLYFERYRLNSYGTYQQQYTWNNEFHLAPYVVEETNGSVLEDSSANLDVNIGVDNAKATIEDFANYRFEDLCAGYFMGNTYHDINNLTPQTPAPDIFVGYTFDMIRDMESYQINAKASLDSYVFTEPFITDESDSSVLSSRLMVNNDELFFDSFDIYSGKDKSTVFKKLPLIQIERGSIRKMSSAWKNSVVYTIAPQMNEDTATSYVLQDKKTDNKYESIDYITLVPPSYTNNYDDTVTFTPRNGVPFRYTWAYTPTYISDTGEEIPGKKKTKFTYGLRYSANNALSLPMFSILGYQIPSSEFNITPDEEFFLEILDGKMVFEDMENGADICLNFHFDKQERKQSVEVNVLYRGDEFNITEYVDGDDTVSRFVNGKSYLNFVTTYGIDPESAVIINMIKSINVNYAGNYTIDVIAKDSHNNIFAANCDNKGIVIPNSFEIVAYTDENVEHGEVSEEDIESDFIPFALFKPNYIIKGIQPKVDASTQSISITYPTYSYSMHTPDPSETVHLLGITDKYKVDAVDRVFSSTNTEINDEKVYEGYSLIMSKDGYKAGRVIEGTDTTPMNLMYKEGVDIFDASTEQLPLCEYMKVFSQSDKNYADVNIIMYNELGGYPVAQTYGTMINDKPFNGGYSGNYRLLVDDDSDMSYIWGSLRESVSSNIKMRIASEIYAKCDEKKVDASVYADTDVIARVMSTHLRDEFIDSSSNVDSSIEAKGYVEEYTDPSTGLVTERLSIDAIYEIMKGDAYNDASVCTNPYDSKFVIPYFASEDTFNICRDVCSLLVNSDITRAVNVNIANIMNPETDGVFLDSSVQDFFNHECGEEEKSINSYVETYHKFNSDLNDPNCDFDMNLLVNGSAVAAAYLLHYCHTIDTNDFIDAVHKMYKIYIADYTKEDITTFMSATAGKDNKDILSYLTNDITYGTLDFEDENFIEDLKVAVITATLPFAKVLSSCIVSTEGYIFISSDDKAAKYWNTIRFALYTYLIGWFIYEYRAKVKAKGESLLIDGNTSLVPYIHNTFDKFEMLYDSSLTDSGVGYSNAICGAILNHFLTLYYSEGIYTANAAYCFAADLTQYKTNDEGEVIDPTMPEGKIPAFYKYLSMNENILFNDDAGIRKDWVTKGKVQYEESGDTAMYALINRIEDASTEPGDVKHYLKSTRNFNGGLQYVGQKDATSNMIVSIDEMIDTNYISLYVKPTWRSLVYVYAISKDSSVYEEYGLDINYDYLFVNYTSHGIATSFKPGEKVKLMFESADDNKYLGQSTYEVVGYDIFDNYILIRGSINNSYLSEHEGGLWSEITDWEYSKEDRSVIRKPVIERKKDQTTQKYIDEWEYKRNGSTIFKLFKNTSFIKSNVIGNNTSQLIPVRYKVDKDELPGSQYEYRWYYKLYGKLAKTPADKNSYATVFPINTVSQGSEKVNMYISYAHHSYVDYPVNATSYREKSDGTTTINLPYDRKTRTYMDFVDDTFSILPTEYDINYAQLSWMDYRRNSIHLGDVDPAIIVRGREIYESPIEDIVLRDTNFIIFKVKDLDDTQIVKWKLYKLVKETSERKPMFECYNPVMYLDCSEKGIYDIEATVYDKYGNASSRLFKNAFKIE